ncbi:MAG: prepilin-type N-terminal cleavage/methylation domain-containing protein [Gammaproteobacteria bacterium]
MKNRQAFCPHQHRGITLVELLIATVIAAVLLGTLLKVYVDSKNSYFLNHIKAEIQSEARASLRILARVVEQAGYRNLRDIRQSNDEVFKATPDFTAGQVLRAAAVGTAGGWQLETRFQGDSDGLISDCLGFTHGDDLIVTQTVTYDPQVQELTCSVRCDSSVPGATLCPNRTALLSDRLRALDLLIGLDRINNDHVIDNYQPIATLSGSESGLLAIKVLSWFESEQNVQTQAQQHVLRTFNSTVTEVDKKLRLAFSDTFSVRSRLP